ncbi:MAG: peptide ABC transporter substrate-binding protein [Candidatus Doudnabacteria bacterium]|nr:peptide ABC transporter substrate-binding protein [Candidatus Doudnabacteria bacterium]
MNGFPHNQTSFAKSLMLGFKELPDLSLSRLRKVFSLLGKGEKITLAILAALAIVSLGISAANFYYSHTVSVPSQGGTYSEGILGQPTYLNPLLASQEPDLSLTNLIFSGLYKYDSNGQLVPDLADGMPVISADQKQYTINLKHNAKWQNGKPVTADDVVFTIQTLQDPDFKSPLRAAWQSDSVSKLSDYSVQFTTQDISGPFLQKLTVGILPKGIWGGIEGQNFLQSKYNLEAVGSGPYSVKQIKKLPSGKVEQISLQAYGDYYGGRPGINEIDIKFYDNDTDLPNAYHSREILGFGFSPLTSGLDTQNNLPQSKSLSIPLQQYQAVFFNLNNAILSDQTIRQALALATDRKAIIDQIFKGQAILPVSPFVFNDPSSRQVLPSDTDLSQAKSLLDQAGWIVDPKTGLRAKKGQPLSLTLSTSDSSVNSSTAQLLASQWSQLGIKVSLAILPNQLLTDNTIKPRNFDVLLYPQKFGADPDPFHFWHSSQIKDPGLNLTGFSDPTVDQLIVDAETTTNYQLRAQDYQQISGLILAKTPVLFLDQAVYQYIQDADVKNVSINSLYDSSQRFDGVESWYMDTRRVWK